MSKQLSFSICLIPILWLSACATQTASVSESEPVVEASHATKPPSANRSEPVMKQTTAAPLKPAAPISAPASSKEPHVATITVRGMSCPLCAHNIEQQLTKIDGVSNVRIDLGEGKVFADVENPTDGTQWAMKQAIGDAGFTALDVETTKRGS